MITESTQTQTPTISRVVTIELNEHDAQRLVWLAHKEAAQSPIWQDYWARLAGDLQSHIDTE